MSRTRSSNGLVLSVLRPGRGATALGVSLALSVFCWLLFRISSGVAYWLLMAATASAALILTARVVSTVAAVRRLRIAVPWIRKAVLTVGALGVVFAFLECVLAADAFWRSDAPSTGSPLTIPKDWQMKAVSVPGAFHAYDWHGKRHVFNKDAMRRVGSFGPKPSDRFRIMVVGDSLTYGHGVDHDDTYVRTLERVLDRQHRVEVLNLGVCGHQSRDILKVVQSFLPVLKPDLVVYGVCVNDLLPSGIGQYQDRPYPFPLPGWFKAEVSHRTRVGKFVQKRYDEILMRLGARPDFYDDILDDFDGYQSRFGRDVAAMNDFVVSSGLPPVVAMVLNQTPTREGKGYRVVMAAEDHLVQAGMNVVSAAGYHSAYHNQNMSVSRWEGHPNERAHQIFADLLVNRIRTLPLLARYRRAASGSRPLVVER